MKRIICAILIVAMLSSCAVMQNPKVAAACQVADGVTTYVALKGGAVEANSFMASMSPQGILLVKFLFAFLIWKAFVGKDLSKGDKAAVGAITFLGCAPALNNLAVIKSLP